ncbi:MAG TPA: acyltransferase family protein [Gammaproteobacteria bacterium]|nr:acyltransferase family protein [Gammaproteobacteria bacterium]
MTPQKEQGKNSRYRPDIDGLRAIAVLSVVAFHAFPYWVKGGFVGVDIFFVIFGFLISTIIFSSLERDAFSFAEFYSRRIRRIFPALLTVLITCFVFGWFALTADEYKQLGKHMAAGAGFVSNFVLWKESGYFDAAAETKPLLHLWSLGIEEQFYIFWPLFLWAVWKKRINLLTITAAVAIVSFTLNLVKYQSDGVADFYSPQTRFWELLAGSLLAYISHHHSQLLNRKTLCHFQSALGAVFIAIGLIFITKEKHFPGTWALLPVIGAVMVIAAGKSAWLNRVVLSNGILVWFGLISFPLYLWHWPLLSFANMIESGVPDRSTRIAAVLISIILAWLTYRLIEHPIRFGKKNNAKVILLAILISLVGLLGYQTFKRDGFSFRNNIQELEEKILRPIKWRDIDNSDSICQKQFEQKYNYCKLAKDETPSIALIGDSFANSYFQGLSEEFAKVGDNLVMLGTCGCPPLLDIKSGFAGQQDRCNAMNSNAIKAVAAMPNVHTIILAANWHLYINGTRFHWHYDRPWEIKDMDAEEKINTQVFSEKMKATIAFLSKSGKKIIIMKQTPEINFNPQACLAKRPFAMNKKEKGCGGIPVGAIKSYLAEYEAVFDSVVLNDSRVSVLDPYPVMCPGVYCAVMDGIYPLYRDDLHLSLYGSKYLASRLKLF